MKFLHLPLSVLLVTLLADAALADPRERGRQRDDRGYEQRDNYRNERRNSREYESRDNYSRRPIRDVIGEVEHNYRGRVVDVQPPRSDADEDMYRVRVLQEGGRVKTLHVPAERRRER